MSVGDRQFEEGGSCVRGERQETIAFDFGENMANEFLSQRECISPSIEKAYNIMYKYFLKERKS